MNDYEFIILNHSGEICTEIVIITEITVIITEISATMFRVTIERTLCDLLREKSNLPNT